MKFEFNQKVWDTVRSGPALVLRSGPDDYVVAEVLSYLKLGRTATRMEHELEPYIEVGLPAVEVYALITAADGDRPFALSADLDSASMRLANTLEEVTGEGL